MKALINHTKMFSMAILLAMFSLISWSQDTIPVQSISRTIPSNLYYVSLGGGYLAHSSLRFTFIHRSNYGGNFSCTQFVLRDDPRQRGMFFGPPPDILNLLTLSFVKEMPVNTPFVRLGMETGISYVHYIDYEDFAVQAVYFIFPSWSYSINETRTVGLNLRLKLEFPLLLAAGLEIGAMINLNPARTVAALDLSITLGKVRGKRIR